MHDVGGWSGENTWNKTSDKRKQGSTDKVTYTTYHQATLANSEHRFQIFSRIPRYTWYKTF